MWKINWVWVGFIFFYIFFPVKALKNVVIGKVTSISDVKLRKTA